MIGNGSDKVEKVQKREEDDSPRRNRLKSFFLFILGALILCGTLGVSAYWLMNRPRAPRHPHVPIAPLVEIEEVKTGTHSVKIYAMGTVIPAEQVDLVAQVNGEIIQVNPELIPGGYLNEGEVLAKIDPRDYRLMVKESKAALTQAFLNCEERKFDIEQHASSVAAAERDLKLEQAQQEIARREYESLYGSNKGLSLAQAEPEALKGMMITDAGSGKTGNSISEMDKELILRKPQLKAAEAAVSAAAAGKEKAKVTYENAMAAKEKAETALRKAELDLQRTIVEVPFNAVVRTKNVGLGSYVSRGSPVAGVVNTGSYWIEVPVPVDRLKWINIPRYESARGSMVRVFYDSAWGKGNYRLGTVKRLEPAIEEQGRMAKVLVEVKDPLCLKNGNIEKPALLLNTFVQLEIGGESLEGAAKIPRVSLREGDRVWLLAPDGTLDIRKVKITATTPDSVFVNEGLKTGDRLITSDIPAPVQGMALRLAGKGNNKMKPPEFRLNEEEIESGSGKGSAERDMKELNP